MQWNPTFRLQRIRTVRAFLASLRMSSERARGKGGKPPRLDTSGLARPGGRPSGTGATAPEYSGSPALLPRPAGERRASRRGHLAGSLRVDLAETAVAPRPGVVSPLGLSHRQPRGVSPAEKGTVLVAAGKRPAARGGGPGRTAGARATGVAGPVGKSSGRR